MEAIKKVDNYKRVRIPAEMQNELGWKIGDQIKIEIEGNKIIMTKIENESEDDLVTQKDISEESLIKARLPSLNDINNVKLNPYNQREIRLSNEDTNDEALDNLRCPECGNRIGKSRFILNNNYICRPCRNNLRDKLIADIKSRKFSERNDT